MSRLSVEDHNVITAANARRRISLFTRTVHSTLVHETGAGYAAATAAVAALPFIKPPIHLPVNFCSRSIFDVCQQLLNALNSDVGGKHALRHFTETDVDHGERCENAAEQDQRSA